MTHSVNRARYQDRTELVPVSEIATMLGHHVDGLVVELLPGARRYGGDWKAGSLDGEPGQSLHVWGRGSKQGEWHDFAAGEGGDLIDLVAQTRCGGDLKQAIQWAKSFLGLDDVDRTTLETRRRQARQTSEQARRDQEADLKKMRARAKALWLEAQPLAGSPGDFYLRGRAIQLTDLPRQPGSLRFHPEVWCVERQARLPAILAAIAAPSLGFLSTHRIWIERRNGGWDKAALQHPRKAYCPYGGGWVEICRGASGRKIKDAVSGDCVVITEGIEDALVMAMVRPDQRVIAGVSLSNLAAIAASLPKAITHVVIAADNDWQTPEAQEALARAKARHQRAGRSVAVLMPGEGKDLNDWLRALSASAPPASGVRRPATKSGADQQKDMRYGA